MNNDFNKQLELLENEIRLNEENSDLNYQVKVLRRLLFICSIMGLLAASSSLLSFI